MKVEVIYISESGKIIVNIVEFTQEDKMPEEGKRYSIWFEDLTPKPEPEFNQG